MRFTRTLSDEHTYDNLSGIKATQRGSEYRESEPRRNPHIRQETPHRLCQNQIGEGARPDIATHSKKETARLPVP